MEKKYSVCFFSFRSLERKVYFTVLTVVKTGLGVKILGNFKGMLSNILK